MTRPEWDGIFKIAAAWFASSQHDPSRAEAYFQALSHLDGASVKTALLALTDHTKFWPSVVEIKASVREIETLKRVAEDGSLPPKARRTPKEEAEWRANSIRAKHVAYRFDELDDLPLEARGLLINAIPGTVEWFSIQETVARFRMGLKPRDDFPPPRTERGRAVSAQVRKWLEERGYLEALKLTSELVAKQITVVRDPGQEG